jgi:TetR/AcrR family transcriptional repressor of mexJK operon
MKTWSTDNPKAGLMARKRVAIVDAAREAFLETGYAETSMNRIAADAGVSIKTVYRHFDNKDELFSAVIQAACHDKGDSGNEGAGLRDPAVDGVIDPAWLAKRPGPALTAAAEFYLHHILSPSQLSLLRIVIRDAPRFPEVAARYRKEVTYHHHAVLETYLRHWATSQGWRIRDYRKCVDVFFAMLRGGLIENALLGFGVPAHEEASAHARSAAKNMLTLLESVSF